MNTATLVAKKDGRGTSTGLLVVSCLVLFFLWQRSDGRADQAESELLDLRKAHAGLQQDAAELVAAVAGIREAVNGFDADNWREVVPDVRSAVETAEEHAEAVESWLDR